MDALTPLDDIDVKSGILEELLGLGFLGALRPVHFPSCLLKDGSDLLQFLIGRGFPFFEDSPEALAVAGFTGFLSGHIGPAFDIFAARLFVKHMAAFAAQAFLQHDVRLGMGDPFAALAAVKDFLSPVSPGVAGPAVGQGFDIPFDLVLNLEVALVALDLVQGDMVQMNEIGLPVFFDSLSFKVALVTVFPRDSAVADDRPAVAFVTLKPVGEDDGVVEAHIAGRSQLFFVMTVRTLVDRWVGFTLFKMADKTSAFCDRNVLALDDLGMAACATEAFAAFQIGQVDLVVEDDLFEFDLPLEEPFIMAALA